MSEFTLTVPAEHAERFRAAIVEEIDIDTEWIKGRRGDMVEAMVYESDRVAIHRVDMRCAMEALERDAATLQPIDLAGEGPVTIRTDDPEVIADLAHVCETMARTVVGDELHDQLQLGPMEDPERLRPLIASLSWAVERAGELYARYGEVRYGEAA